MSLNPSEIGRIGESEFSSLCAKAKYTINSSTQDDHGWDFLLELPSRHPIGVNTLNHAVETIFVQVKATTSRQPKTQVKLSNLRKLATSPIPCFIALHLLNSEHNTEVLYLKHVDHTLVEKWLQWSAQHINDKLNTIKKLIKFDKSEILLKVHQNELDSAIRSAVGDSYNQYLFDKSKLLEKLGTPQGKMHFTLKSLYSPNPLADLFTGALDKVQLDNLCFSEELYGIERPHPQIQVTGPAELRLTPKSFDKCTIYVTDPETDIEYEIPGDLFLPPTDLLHENYKPMRIETETFAIQINLAAFDQPQSASFTSKLEPNKALPITYLANAIPILHLFEHTQEPCKIKIHSEKYGPLQASFNSNSQDSTLKEASKSAQNLCDFCQLKNLATPTHATPQQIADQSTAISFLWLVAQRHPKPHGITLNCTFEVDKQANVACAICTHICLGEHVLIGITINVGKPIPSDLTQVSISDITIHDVLVFSASDVDNKKIKDSMEAALAPYKASHITHIFRMDF
ncbi:hypothetical protein CWE13_07815 [Aliidiomarina shirensis]|uniref:DUF4365 domain-containing protein n=1 Tax=Aliidiomarina shirensis TaxID=1048642 RepID=A0A432WSL1_9GAMM|nr:DUF4365 domain-containing protein [Aliidiomarina shirensis]RUO36747.1 hypothetical protein CWE13_07815 [Aliidiomarina shirensis]